MNNYGETGYRLDYTNEGSTDIASGAVVLLTNRIGIAVTVIAAGEIGAVQTEGVFTLDKTSGEAWTVGQQLYWVVGTSKITSTAGANEKAGIASAAAASLATTGSVKINA